MEYFKQLTAEKMVKGATAPHFIKIHSRANEALDARIYALAAREFLPGVNYPKIAANLAIAPESDWRPDLQEKSPEGPPPPPPEPPPVIPSNLRTPPPPPPKVRRAMSGWGRAY
jgi:phage terminase large subunit GpA-like protein